MKVVWSAEAAQQLRDIVGYIANENPKVARLVAARLLRRSRQLAQPPLTGRRLPEYPRADLRECLECPFRLIYRISATGIEIVALKHYRQRLPADPHDFVPGD